MHILHQFEVNRHAVQFDRQAMKQTNLLAYMGKKRKNTPNQPARRKSPQPSPRRAPIPPPASRKHSSSREGTIRLDESDNQSLQVRMEKGCSIRPKRGGKVCPLYVMMTPVSTINWGPVIRPKLIRLQKEYSTGDLLEFISSNLRFYSNSANINNLLEIKDDHFWNLTAPQMLTNLISRIEKECGVLRVIPEGFQEVVDMTRGQIFLLTASMFLGIMPKQPHESITSFAELMTARQNEPRPAKIRVRREKLRCLMCYLSMMVEHPELWNETVHIQRTSNKSHQLWNTADFLHNVPLLGVSFKHLKEYTIQDYCGQGIMVDFANKHLGGGVLGNGAVQQEIMMMTFPQLLVARLVCPPMTQSEAVIVYGARRMIQTNGYSDGFQFVKPLDLVPQEYAQRSVIVCIDAVNFKDNPSDSYQYSKKGVRRQLNKAYAGFEGASYKAGQQLAVCTGKWGCGAFQGDEEMKFVIQWIACSEAGRAMVYVGDSQQKLKEFEILVDELVRQVNTLDLVNVLDQYYKMRTIKNRGLSLLDYIKNCVI